MTRLSQIVALSKGAQANGERALTDAYQSLQKANLLSGITRNYTPKDDEGDKLPPESTLVQLTVLQVFNNISEALTRMFDVVLTKDSANTTAVADIVVNGTTLATGVPVPYLLYLEKQLVNLGTFISKLPVLDPAEVWVDEEAGVHRTAVTSTVRTKKVPKNWVKAEATDKHPAQVEIFHEDVIVGTWNTTKLSGAVTQATKATLIKRVRDLQDAVKVAREEANATVIEDRKVGAALFSYLLAQ